MCCCCCCCCVSDRYFCANSLRIVIVVVVVACGSHAPTAINLSIGGADSLRSRTRQHPSHSLPPPCSHCYLKMEILHYFLYFFGQQIISTTQLNAIAFFKKSQPSVSVCVQYVCMCIRCLCAVCACVCGVNVQCVCVRCVSQIEVNFMAKLINYPTLLLLLFLLLLLLLLL